MKDIIETLIKNNYRVTIVEGESEPVQFYVGAVVDDMTDIWYLSQLCAIESLDVGVVLFKGNAAYFPRLAVDKDIYDFILKEQQ